MAGSSATSELMWGRPNIVVGIIVILLLLINAGSMLATGDRSNLLVESRHAWKESGAAKKLALSAVASSRKSTTDLDRSLNRRIVVTSGVGTSKNRGEVDALTAFRGVITSDPLGVLRSWHANGSDHCGWEGVRCSSQHPRHVVALSLGECQLVGNITSALQKLGNLPFLRHLDLSSNYFSGSIPGSSLANFSNLLYLDVSLNEVRGEIPSQLGELVELQFVYLDGNNLTGEIPVSLGNCTLLRELILKSNSIEGPIPSMLGRLSSLEVLNMGTNNFIGSIPPALGNCTSLTLLEVGADSYPTNLGGELPAEFSRLKKLALLDLSGCNLQGALPSWITNLTALSSLYLPFNKFQGEIPDNIGRLHALEILALEQNHLTGAIPVSISNCTTLTGLGFERNYLTGDIPHQLGLLWNLEKLYLWENRFTGRIPSSLANCSALTDLKLGGNLLLDPQFFPSWIGSLSKLSRLYLHSMNLRGEILEEIGQLSYLRELVLVNNSLTGEIPASLGNCTWLNVLQLDGNLLTGGIRSEIGLLSQLVRFGVAANSLTGSFPAFIANLTDLEYFSVIGNLLTGKIAGDFRKLSELQNFFAGVNQFSGLFPESLSNCSNLNWMILSENNLTGELPPSLGNMTSLVQLELADNQFDGMIPLDLWRTPKLLLLDLELNQLEGNLPPIIGELVSESLAHLYLNNNNLGGILPSSLGNCSNLLDLDLSFNNFTGSVPGDAISKMSQLKSLNLSHNLLSGSWPQQLSRLTNLQEIDVSFNKISGSILPGLGSCTSLGRIDISVNNLTSRIPQDLGSLRHLEFLNASYNNFQGPIPDFKTNLTRDSFMGNPGLCGSILGRACAAPPTSIPCEGFKCKKAWIPTTCVLLIVVLVVAGGVLYRVTIIHKATRMYNTYQQDMNFAPHFRFSEDDLMRAIEGNEDNIIGRGAKSVVYKGVTGDGQLVAIKILPSCEGNDNIDNCRRESELLTEVHTLSILRHRNILKVLSFCSTLDVKAIILEYMPEGSLHKHLHEHDMCDLTWEARFKIALGVAEAMKYLHHDFPEPIIHRDLKPSNILLDANLDPKVGDFGVSKFVNENQAGEATASTFCGTIGYMPPEYALGTNVSTKGDVYSYGMVLLELLMGRQPTRTSADSSRDNFEQHVGLREWVMESFHETPLELLDSTLKHEGRMNTSIEEQMMLLMRVALICTAERPHSRPFMSDVLAMLKQIKGIGLVPTTPKTLEDLANEITVWATQDANVEEAAPGSHL